MKQRRFRNRFIYVLNLCLIFVHSMIAIYLKEWNLLKLPGGESLYLITLTVILILAIAGMTLILNQRREGLYFALGMGLSGVIIFGYHLYAIALYGGEPVYSVILIGTILALTAVQLWMAVRTLSRPRRKHSRVPGLQVGFESGSETK